MKAKPGSVDVLFEEVTAFLARLATPRRHHIASGLQVRDGSVITGINLVSNLGPSSVCAEQVALGKCLENYPAPHIELVLTLRATFRPEAPFEAVPPCGRCRELLCEFAPGAQVAVPRASSAEGIDIVPVAHLLPIPFVRR